MIVHNWLDESVDITALQSSNPANIGKIIRISPGGSGILDKNISKVYIRSQFGTRHGIFSTDNHVLSDDTVIYIGKIVNAKVMVPDGANIDWGLARILHHKNMTIMFFNPYFSILLFITFLLILLAVIMLVVSIGLGIYSHFTKSDK